jgi:DNA polymerase III subunit delta
MLPETIKDLPIVTILHGDDDYQISQGVADIVRLMGDPSLADLNITRLDGSSASLDEVKNNASTLPFLAERRMVILTHPLARGSKALSDKMPALLDGLPESAALVLVVDDVYERKDWLTLSIKKPNWLRSWAQSAGKRARLITYQLPNESQMTAWIMARAKLLKGQFDPRAAAELTAHVGNDTRIAAHEVEKLLTYVDFKRPVNSDDVNLLTITTNSVNIFDMVDAVAQQNSRKAVHLLHRLLEQQEPISLFFMIVRQFRLLIQAREILDEGGSVDEIQNEMHQHPFVSSKLAEQARRFPMARLEIIYRRLFEMDEAMKTSQMSLELSLDTFIASLA